jgi:formylmethanofuran dehydrogenase subunit E
MSNDVGIPAGRVRHAGVGRGIAVNAPSSEPTFEAVAAFHGHVCLDIALGYRVAIAALRELACARPRDEELVAIVENDSCSVDAVQAVTGCTFGKGNLVYHPYGKAAYTFVDRRSGRAVRIYCHFWEAFDRGEGVAFAGLMNRVLAGEASGPERERFGREMAAISQRILALPERELFSVSLVETPPPPTARIFSSAACEQCGEWTMETRLAVAHGKRLCLPCREAAI